MPSSLTAPQASAQANKQKYHVLIVEDLQGKRSIPLSYATYSLGRDASNSIQLHDRAASRHHLILIRMPLPNNEYLYRAVDGDANGKASLNGIVINGTPRQTRDLISGDEIRVGEITTIRYMLQRLTDEEFEWYFSRQDQSYRSIQESISDPITTMTTILSC